jgi:hypothetical protein
MVDYGEDFLQRIVAVHWPRARRPSGLFLPQQGLIAYFDNDNGGHGGEVYAVALDSGQKFSGINMGASGMGYTVLTGGLVCFGQPLGGDPCFMACPDYQPDNGGAEVEILRGTRSNLASNVDDPSLEIQWQSVTHGPVLALTFAAGGFFAVYQSQDGGPTSIASSFDGKNFSVESAYPYNPDLNQHGGAVAGLRDRGGRAVYVSCGSLDVEEVEPGNPYYGLKLNLAWATSSSGTGWSYAANESQLSNPGSFVGSTGGTNLASAVAAGNGIFVAAATDKKVIMSDADPPLPYVTHTGAVATSGSGSGWSTIILPGAVPAGQNSYSSASCVTFVQTALDPKTGLSAGYFLCGGAGYDGNTVDFSPASGVWRSADGSGWSQVISNRIYPVTLSTIARDLSKTKIIRL